MKGEPMTRFVFVTAILACQFPAAAQTPPGEEAGRPKSEGVAPVAVTSIYTPADQACREQVALPKLGRPASRICPEKPEKPAAKDPHPDDKSETPTVAPR